MQSTCINAYIIGKFYKIVITNINSSVATTNIYWATSVRTCI